MLGSERPLDLLTVAYLPARWWHLVKCRADSLSISVGVMPPAAFREAKHVPAGWVGSPRRAPDGER